MKKIEITVEFVVMVPDDCDHDELSLDVDYDALSFSTDGKTQVEGAHVVSHETTRCKLW